MLSSSINIAFDSDILSQDTSFTDQNTAINEYYFDEYTKKYIPINGAQLHYTLNTQKQGNIKKRESSFARGDHFCPLHVICEEYDITPHFINLEHALQTNEKFLYYVSPRFFVRQHLSVPRQNYLKDLLSPKLIQAINSGQCLFFICDIFECSYYTSYVIETFQEMCKEAELDINKIVILTNNINNINRFNVDIIYWQYFESATKMAHKYKLFDQYDTTDTLQKFRFLLLNCRSRQHRYYICFKLWQTNPNFLKDTSFSLNKITLNDLLYNCDSYMVRDCLKSDFHYFVKEYSDDLIQLEKFLTCLPSYSIFDEKYKTQQMYMHYYKNEHREQVCSNTQESEIFYRINHWKHFNKAMQTNVGIHIVTETLADFINTDQKSYLFLTEKIFKPIIFEKPFIVVSQPGTLKHLHECGYQTFHQSWDESYDSISDPLQRYNTIVKLILHLSSLSDDVFNNLLDQTKSVTSFNATTIKKRQPEFKVVEKIQNFFK